MKKLHFTIQDLQNEYLGKLMAVYSRREAENITNLVFGETLKLNRIELITQKNIVLAAGQVNQLYELLERLIQEEPVQYIIGHTHFYGLQLLVTPGVLIPRPETEELVDWILLEVTRYHYPVHILDVGTGSGCIALALKKNMTPANVTGIDISEAALSVAKANGEKHQLPVIFRRCNILDKNNWKLLAPTTFDLIVSNPPYVLLSEKGKMAKNVVKYEPAAALFVEDNNPLIFYQAIAEAALQHLAPNGKMYFEINESMGNAVASLLRQKGFGNIELKKDLSGKARMIRCAKE